MKSAKVNKDLDAQQHMASLLNSGAIRQQGIIVALKTDFGFIKPVDQPHEIFFKLHDVIRDPATVSRQNANYPSIREVFCTIRNYFVFFTIIFVPGRRSIIFYYTRKQERKAE